MRPARICDASVWVLLAGLLALILAVRDASAWTADPTVNVPMCTAYQVQWATGLARDGEGGAIVAWHDYRTVTSYDIYVRRVDATGVPQWTVDGVALCTATGNQRMPRVVEDGSGGAIVAWTDQRGGGSGLYAQRVNADGVPMWTADGVVVATGAVPYDRSVAAVPDGAGGMIVTWYDERTAGAEVYAQRLNSAGARQWGAGGVLVSGGSPLTGVPSVASDGSGGAIVAWPERRVDVNGDLYAQWVSAAGNLQWGTGGKPVCTVTGGVYSNAIVGDGAGGAILGWVDLRSGVELYAQRLDDSGTPQWTGDGVVVATITGDLESEAMLVSDGSGGAVFAWRGSTVGGGNVYAQRLSGAGAQQWGASGVPVSVGYPVTDQPAMAGDGAGGAYVVWPSARIDAYWDLYAQHVQVDGAALWTPNGQAVSTAPNYQQSPMVVAGTPGTMLVAWTDSRTDTLSGNETNVYAQRIPFSEVLGAPGWPRESGLEIAAVYPNPARNLVRFRIASESGGPMRGTVVDVVGRRVHEWESRWIDPGTFTVLWDGRDRLGKRVEVGVYFVRVDVGGRMAHRRLIVIH